MIDRLSPIDQTKALIGYYNGIAHWVFPALKTIMTTDITLDQAGRVVIPKSLRTELHLSAGDTLRLESDGDRITLHPVRAKARLSKEHGIWVVHGECTEPIDVVEFINQQREQRSGDILGIDTTP